MDDYVSQIKGFDSLVNRATSESLSPYFKSPDGIRQYSDSIQETLSETKAYTIKEDIEVCSYLLPKKVIVKTFKLKKI